ncbi:MAG: DUF397 domain-containing protein [Actinobacteria bacterium]|nr:DUF397 domain-containing protein [Actinomycetota bacterium]
MTEYDVADAAWITSRACNNSACVQVAHLADGRVAVRDSKDTARPAHIFDREEWAVFIAGVKAGDFDLPA